MTAALLRYYPASQGIFNSLMDLHGCSLEGVHPSPPAAVCAMPKDVRDRCVNLTNCWEHPSDLTKSSTWAYLNQVKENHIPPDQPRSVRHGGPKSRVRNSHRSQSPRME